MSDLLNKASLVVIPSGYKEDTVYSVVPSDGAGDLSFTRASNGTRINSAGLVEVCPWNMAQQSNSFSTSPWALDTSGGTLPTLTANYGTAPDGTQNAWRIQLSRANTSSSYSQLYQYPITVIAGQQYTWSVYLKSLSGTPTISIIGDFGRPPVTLTSEWVRYTGTGTASSGLTQLEIAILGSNFSAGNSLSADFLAYGYQLNIGSTAKPYFPTTDRLNVPRLTYQNGGGGCPSLLLEKQSTNILLYSEQFDNAAWTQYQGGTITANSVISPDGTQNAETLTVASGQTYSGIYQSVSGSNDVYTVSIFAKQNTKRFIYLFDASASAAGWFDLQNGVLGTIPSGYTGSIENFGNGWFRCIFKKNSAVTPAFFQIGLADADGFSTPSSSGSSYIWGAQLEASSYPTSYIPTTSASATRVADVCIKTGISSLFGTNQGTFFIDLIYYGSETFSYLFDITDSSNVNRFLMYDSNGSGLFYFYDSGYAVVDFIQLTKGERYKISVKYNSSGTIWYVNGVLKGTGTVSFAHQMSQIYLGIRYSITANAGIKVNQTIVFPTALTNAELAQLTA